MRLLLATLVAAEAWVLGPPPLLAPRCTSRLARVVCEYGGEEEASATLAPYTAQEFERNLRSASLDTGSAELRVQMSPPAATPESDPTAPRRGSAEHRLQQLRALVRATGSCEVANHPDASLRRWAARQRWLKREGALSEEITERLDDLGFAWDPLQRSWDRRYEALAAHYARHGHASPLRDHDASLASWVARQRAAHRQKRLSAERAKQLREIDFEFDPLAAAWEGHYSNLAAALLAQRAKGGGGALPAPLTRWLARQRKAREAGTLSAERIDALEQLKVPGFGLPHRPRLGNLLRLGRDAPRAPEPGRAEGEGSEMAYAACAHVGRALLISVGRNRPDADAELADAREALTLLGYVVISVENPTRGQLEAALRTHAKAAWEDHASSVVALMAHGRGARVECHDGEYVDLADLFGTLSPTAAPGLAGKPKVWLVQACRRGAEELLSGPPIAPAAVPSGADAAAADAAGVGSDTEVARSLTREHDYLWAFATTPGSVAYRGAMMAALRRVVEAEGRSATWLDLLHRANDVLSSWSGTGALEEGARVLPSMEIRSTCRGPAFSADDLSSTA